MKSTGLGLGDEEGSTHLTEMLGSLARDTNLFKRLQMLEVIFNMMDDDVAKKIDMEEFKKFLEVYTDNHEFMKKAKRISIVEDNVETALEYYGQDYISTPEFNYDEKFQLKRRGIDKKINSFIGKALKELDEEEDFLD